MRRVDSQQMIHSDTHTLGHRHHQGTDGGRLVHHSREQSVCRNGTQARLVVGKSPVNDLPSVPAQGCGPVLALTSARYR